MSFYVTLPSNASSQQYNNTQSNYTTLINNPFMFSVPYEFALVEFSYREFMSFDIGSIHVKFEGTDFLPYKILAYDNEPIVHFIDRFNYQIAEYFKTILKDINNTGKNKINYSSIPQLIITITNNVILRVKECQVRFDGLSKELFKANDEILNNDHSFIMLSESLNFFDYLMLYCDLAEPQCVGDTFAPLLRSICKTGAFNTSTEKIYTNPHYIPVCKSFINSINIDIRDPAGEQVKFENSLSKVLVKLHFRPIRNV